MSVVTSIVPGRVIEICHSNFVGPKVNPAMEAVEQIELKERRDKTLVVRRIAVKNHGVPFVFIPLLWFVSRFGHPTEPDPLKLLCERGEVPERR